MKSHIGATCLLSFCAVMLLASCTYTPETVAPPPPPPPPTATPLPFLCDAYTEDHWRELRFGEDTPEGYEETVEKVWGVKAWTIPIRIEESEDLWGRWNADSTNLPGLSYRVLFDRKEKLLHVASYWWRISPPTLAQAIDCLGSPEYYIAAIVEDRYDWLEFSLWYVEKGFVIHGSSRRPVISGQSDWPSIKPGTLTGGSSGPQKGDFIVVAPGKLERMAIAVYGPSLQAWELCLIRPWPGSISSIEIMSFEEYLSCAT